MRTVPFQSVLNGVAVLLGLDPSRDLGAAQASKLTGYIGDRLKEGWRWDFWPEWTVSQPRFYRDVFDASRNVSVGDERYHIASQAYYQALQAQSPAAQAPATLTGTVWVENSAWWARCAGSYGAADWLTGTAYVVGNQVRNGADGELYQCISAHTAGGVFDASKFGRLKAFDRYVAYEQVQQGVALTPIDEVKGVSKRNPRVFKKKPGWLEFEPSDNGIQVNCSTAPNSVWITFRLRPPEFSSVRYSVGETVAAGVIRYDPTTGECYVAVQTSTGQAVTNATYWSKVNFPAAIASYVKRATAADGLKDQKQTDRSVEELEEAQAELADACDRALAQQGQFERAGVQTYGS